MRTVKALVGVLVLASITFSLVACRCPVDFTTKQPGARLLGHFLSFSSFEEIRSRQLPGRHFVFVQQTRCRTTEERPCFQIVVRKTAFEHLDVKGELWLTFFNDRLYGTMFYPTDFDRYHHKLAQSGVQLPRSSEPLELSRNTLVWSGSDGEHRSYVAWIDRRLLDENARWIRCYGEPGDGENGAPLPPNRRLPHPPQRE